MIMYVCTCYAITCIHAILGIHVHAIHAMYMLHIFIGLCVGGSKRNQCSICHKISSVLYGKYSTVILVLVCNQCSKLPPWYFCLPMWILDTALNGFTKASTKDHCELKPAQRVVQKVVTLLSLLSLQPAPRLTVFQYNNHHWHLNHEASVLSVR